VKYRWNKSLGVTDEAGKQIIQLVASNCTNKFRNIAGALLVEKLNHYDLCQERIKAKKEDVGK
jgi:hypothetical protein